MTSVVVSTEPTVDERDRPTVAVAAEDDAVAERILVALTRDGLRVQCTRAAPELAPGAMPDLLVLYWDEVTAERLVMLRDLRRKHDRLHVVVLCRSADGKGARRVVSRGVDGLVFAERIETTLPPTIRAVLAGQAVVPAKLTGSPSTASLSLREKQILGLVALGLPNGQIAAWLCLSESTVKSHLSSAFTKLGVRSRSEAASLIFDPTETLGAGILKIAEQLREARAQSPIFPATAARPLRFKAVT
jgi:DNA-binding NarL/FixJ family response regulator